MGTAAFLVTPPALFVPLSEGVAKAIVAAGLLIQEARDLDLLVEPGVQGRRNALVRWAVLLGEVLL